jgi:pimeloyl-ACP methyl ester carboxylesterase
MQPISVAATKLTFVLVHGAWHGSWCWARVVPLLREAGHRVFAVTLTGQGDRAHLAGPAIGLSTHIEDVVATLEMEDLRDVVLVGHSYGGLVITGAAERSAERIRRLVYLDALVPNHGQCGFDLNSPQFRERLERDAQEHGDGYKVSPIIDILGITDPQDLAWVRARLRPLPIKAMEEKVHAPEKVKAIPSTFILCKGFGFKSTADRCRAAGWPVLEIDCGHDVMILKPGELAQLLMSASCG